MNTMTSNKLVLFTLVALVLGILFGLFLPGLMLALAFAGDLFLNVLQVLFIPLVASAVISGVSAFSGRGQVAKAALATLSLFIGTTIAAILIGIILTIIIEPGAGINTGAGFVPGEIINAPVTQSLDFLGEILPSNIINAVTHGKFLGWMIVLTIAASVLGTLGSKSKPVTDFFETIYSVVQKVLGVVVNLVPVGLFFVIGTVVARNAGSFGVLTDSLGKFSAVLLLGFLIHGLVVIPLVLKFFANRSPWEYFLNVFPAIKTALVAGSPTVALPVTFENTVERNKIDNRVAAMVLPVGSSLNVSGRALYVTVSALFLAQAFDVSLGFLGIVYVAVAALFFSLGTGTVSFVGMLSLVFVMDFAGFPTAAYAGIGIIFAVDWFWSRMFAALDVWTNTTVAAAVDENIVAEVPQPERKERPDYDQSRRFDRGRPQGRRDFPPHRGRDDSRGRDDRRRPDFRSDRPPRPYSKPEREPVPLVKPQPKPERFPERERAPERSAPSPFELKMEITKPFSPDPIKSSEPPAPKPPAPKKVAADSSTDERRKLREKKQFSHGHDVNKRGAREFHPPAEADFAEQKISPPSPPRAVAPPPLIRDLEKPRDVEPEQVPAAATQKINIPEPTERTGDDAQTSLFGRAPQRKGIRPKSDEPPKPVEDAESFSTKEQSFGRGVKKKKNS